MKHGRGDEMWWKGTFNEAKYEGNQMNDYHCHKWTTWVYQNLQFFGTCVCKIWDNYIKHNPHLPWNLEMFSSFPNWQNYHTCILPPRPRWRLVDVASTPLPLGLTSANKIKTCQVFWKNYKFGCPNDTCFIHVHFDSCWFIFIHLHTIYAHSFQRTDDPVTWKRQNTVLQNHLQ